MVYYCYVLLCNKLCNNNFWIIIFKLLFIIYILDFIMYYKYRLCLQEQLKKKKHD